MANLKVFKTKKINIGELVHNNIQCECFVGSRGIGKKTREGDKVTPIGTFMFSEVYYRPDKVKYLKTCLPLKKINKKSFWCIDPKSKFYNSFQTKKNYVCEDLYRDDDLYDIFITFNYNLGNIKKFKGSAIFLHCSDISKDHTDGCIALEKEILLKLLNSIKTYSKLIIL